MPGQVSMPPISEKVLQHTWQSVNGCTDFLLFIDFISIYTALTIVNCLNEAPKS